VASGRHDTVRLKAWPTCTARSPACPRRDGPDSVLAIPPASSVEAFACMGRRAGTCYGSHSRRATRTSQAARKIIHRPAFISGRTRSCAFVCTPWSCAPAACRARRSSADFCHGERARKGRHLSEKSRFTGISCSSSAIRRYRYETSRLRVQTTRTQTTHTRSPKRTRTTKRASSAGVQPPCAFAPWTATVIPRRTEGTARSRTPYDRTGAPNPRSQAWRREKNPLAESPSSALLSRRP
jgi:hypothetical protein